jgi:hypothetical protein
MHKCLVINIWEISEGKPVTAMLGGSPVTMACPQVADGGDGLQILRVAANILNKQSGTADKGWFSSLGVGCGVNNFLLGKKK